MNKFTYFDVEYANPKNRSICQMGLMCEDYFTGEPFYPEQDIYINPEDNFDIHCVRVHGITKDRVANEPSFPEIWKDIEKYFTNSVVVGHNVASSDLDALVKNLRRYNIDIPELYCVCTFELAKEYVPSYLVKDYSLATLCEYFDIDIDSEHNAFDDACADADLLRALVEEYSIDVSKEVRKYIPHETNEFESFISDPELRRAVSDFYGVIKGFLSDNKITVEEKEYIKEWKDKFSKYDNQKEIHAIISVIDYILTDDIITVEEISLLQDIIVELLNKEKASQETLSSQILNGILRGITVDGKITEEECKDLRQWLYDNINLSGHFPFNKTMELIEKVLEDGVITPEESKYITDVITDMLDPVDSLKAQVNSVEGKHVCLSGVFEYGEKADVQTYIIERGGLIDSSVKKTTDILMIGNYECQAYSNGTYGTKVKKAIEYNEKGCNIKIVKESDFFSTIK